MLYFTYGLKVSNTNDCAYMYLDVFTGYLVRVKEKMRANDMFNIKCVDIGGNGLVVDFDSMLDTLVEVEILVTNAICEKLGVSCVQLEHVEDLVYIVWINGHEIGVVVIKDVNPVPTKRK